MSQLEHFGRKEISNANSLMTEILAEAKLNIEESQSENTTLAYESDWIQFQKWCSSYGFSSLPSSDDTIGLYLTNLAMEGYKTSSIHRKMSAIITAHQDKGYGSPITQKVKRVMSGIRRRYGSNENGKKPLLVGDILSMLKQIPDNVKGSRDKALLLIGFAGAFRRSELVNLDVEDIRIDQKGLVVMIKKSKTDQYGQGQSVGIPFGRNKDTCPVEAYRSWLRISNLQKGPIFRPINRHGQIQMKRLSDKAVALIVKEYANTVGL
ncbi:site-specific integrase [Paenibacillus sp. FSL P4-0288]|uniref:site-specific integrase n=1 Tax=Paenibacillus sp. FSL P4-0288 TaxID=2921633 RepID=UPI0030FB531D